MMRQKISIPIETKSILILYENNAQKEAIYMSSQYRKDGIYVTLICKRENASMEGYKKYARRNEFTKMYYMSDANAHAEKIELY